MNLVGTTLKWMLELTMKRMLESTINKPFHFISYMLLFKKGSLNAVHGEPLTNVESHNNTILTSLICQQPINAKEKNTVSLTCHVMPVWKEVFIYSILVISITKKYNFTIVISYVSVWGTASCSWISNFLKEGKRQ